MAGVLTVESADKVRVLPQNTWLKNLTMQEFLWLGDSEQGCIPPPIQPFYVKLSN